MDRLRGADTPELSLLDRLRRFQEEQLWSRRRPSESSLVAGLRALVQFAVVVVQGFSKDLLLLRAHSLTFLTFLSLIPLLALAVSLTRLFGLSEGLIQLMLEQIAAGSPQAVEFLLPMVQSLNFGALGTVGGVGLGATTVLMIGSVERSLNAIWGITKQRPWVRRIPDYLAVLLVSPLLLGVALSLTTTLQSQWIVQKLLEVPGFETLYSTGLQQAPALLAIIAFSFLYWFLPNTDVRVPSALVGGAVAGVLFTVAQKVYIGFNVGAAKYGAMFGTFAFLPLLLVWIYFAWSIILLGAEVAFAHQTLPLYRREVRGTPPGGAARERLGVAVSLEVARSFEAGREAWEVDALSDALDVPVRTVREILDCLEEAGLIAPLAPDGKGDRVQLARPADRVRVVDVLDALRGPRRVELGDARITGAVEGVFGRIEAAAGRTAENLSLRDVLDEASREPAGPEPT